MYFEVERKLSSRLAAIADFIPKGARIADIGTDHALLPIFLTKAGVTKSAVAGDVHDGPYQAARLAVQDSGLSDFIEVRKGDGLSVVNPGEVDVIVIAGMGGGTICQILKDRMAVVSAACKLVLQPMVGAAGVRRWLNGNGWSIQQEDLIREDGVLYQIIVAVPGTEVIMAPVWEEVGPVLWEQRHPLLKEHLESLLAQTERILNSMARGKVAKQSEKYLHLINQRQQLEEMRRCL